MIKLNYKIFFFGILVSLVFSTKWIYPFYIDLIEDNYSYVPIKHSPYNTNDDYFYYSHIREVIDSKGFSYDPVSFENKNLKTPHFTYNLSFYISAIGGFISRNTSHAYYFNYLVFPLINFILIFNFFLIFIKKNNLSVFLALMLIFLPFPAKYFILPWEFIYEFLKILLNQFSIDFNILFSNQLRRTPNILITNIHLFSFSLLFYNYLKKNNNKFIEILFLSILIGISSFVSVQNFLIIYSAIFVFILSFWRNDYKRIKLIKVFMYSIIFALPGLIAIYETLIMPSIYIENNNQIFYGTNKNIDIENGFILNNFISEIFKLVLPILVLSFIKFKDKKFILTFIISIIIIYFSISIFFGTFKSGKLLSRGSELLFSSLFISGLLQCIIESIKDGFFTISISKINKSFNINTFKSFLINNKIFIYSNRLIFNLSIIICVCGIINQISISRSQYKNYNEPEFKELYKWTISNTNLDDVVLTMDADLLINLPAFSPMNMFIPQAILSPTTHDERYERLFETIKFYGFNENDFKYFLDSLLYNGKDLKYQKNNYIGMNLALMDLALFYGRYSHSKRSKVELENFINKYKIYISKNPKSKFKKDYIIISEFDELIMKKDSEVSNLINKSKALFINDKYKVYRISKL